MLSLCYKKAVSTAKERRKVASWPWHGQDYIAGASRAGLAAARLAELRGKLAGSAASGVTAVLLGKRQAIAEPPFGGELRGEGHHA